MNQQRKAPRLLLVPLDGIDPIVYWAVRGPSSLHPSQFPHPLDAHPHPIALHSVSPQTYYLAPSAPDLIGQTLNQLQPLTVEKYDPPSPPVEVIEAELATEGSFGTVYKAKDQKGRTFALKKWKSKQTEIPPEYEIMKKFDSPYLCRVYNCYFDATNFGVDRPLCVVMPFYPTTLEKRIRSSKGSLTGKGVRSDEALILRWLRELATGLVTLHSSKITHRDLKPGNLLLDNDSIVIGDFGEAGVGTYIKGLNGSANYVAPEVWDSADTEKKYSQTADMWSVGIILLDMLTLNLDETHPFKAVPEARIDKIRKKFSAAIVTIVEKLLVIDRKKRMTSKELKDLLEKMPPLLTSSSRRFKVDPLNYDGICRLVCETGTSTIQSTGIIFAQGITHNSFAALTLAFCVADAIFIQEDCKDRKHALALIVCKTQLQHLNYCPHVVSRKPYASYQIGAFGFPVDKTGQAGSSETLLVFIGEVRQEK